MTIATWLLIRFGVDEALLGDLIEQHNAGRPRAWLWRQVRGAIFSTLVRDMTAHPFRATIAVLLALQLRYLTTRVWGSYEPSVDMRIVGTLLDAVSPLGRHAWIVALGWANSIVLAPAWFLIGFVLARLSRAAVPIFIALAVAFLLPGMTRQLQGAMASDMVRWLLPVQLTIFGASIGTFALAVLGGATCGLGKRHDIV
jgi:hypothetical protein